MLADRARRSCSSQASFTGRGRLTAEKKWSRSMAPIAGYRRCETTMVVECSTINRPCSVHRHIDASTKGSPTARIVIVVFQRWQPLVSTPPMHSTGLFSREGIPAIFLVRLFLRWNRRGFRLDSCKRDHACFAARDHFVDRFHSAPRDRE